MNKINKLLYVSTFILLYIGVALVSTLHAFEFFKLTNTAWIAAVLAGSFEIGQAAVLFSILTTKEERGKVMPWVLMLILTAVQIIGNVYACYRYVVTNSMDMLRYFREPIFIWTKLPDEQSTVILTYIASSILPIVALCMTAMITSFLNNGKKDEMPVIDEKDKTPEEVPINDTAPEPINDIAPEPVKQTDAALGPVKQTDAALEPVKQTDAAPEPVKPIITEERNNMKGTHMVSL